MLRASLRPSGLGLLLVLGCNNATNPGDPPVSSITPGTQWSGGEIALTSTAIDPATLPVIVAGVETLTVSRVDDSTVSVRLPLGGSGAVTLELAQGTKRIAVGGVQRVGFSAYNEIGPVFQLEVTTAMVGGAPVVFGNQPAGGGSPQLQMLDLAALQMTQIPSYRALYYGLGPTFETNKFLMLDSQVTRGVWQLAPLPPALDTAVTPPFMGGSVLSGARLSDTVYLSITATSIYTSRVIFSGVSGFAAFLSPTLNVATVAAGGVFQGVPVFDAATGDTLYTLGPTRRNAQWATFSPDGSTLYFLIGTQLNHADSLLAVTATTGQPIQALKLHGTGRGWNLAADPVKPLLYVETVVDSLPRILIYRTTDLGLVGELSVPAAGLPDPGFEGALSVDRVRNRLHVTWTQEGNSQVNPVWTFDLLP